MRPDVAYLGRGQPAPAGLARAGAGGHVHGHWAQGARGRRNRDLRRRLADLEHIGARFLYPARPLPGGASNRCGGPGPREFGTADNPDFSLAKPRRESRIIRRLLMATMENDKVAYPTHEGLNPLHADLTH